MPPQVEGQLGSMTAQQLAVCMWAVAEVRYDLPPTWPAALQLKAGQEGSSQGELLRSVRRMIQGRPGPRP